MKHKDKEKHKQSNGQMEEQVMDEKELQEEASAEKNEVEDKAAEVQATSEEESSDQLEAALQEAKDKYLRLYSEFENFRRRTARERLELVGSANRDLLEDFLPVIDDLERAKKSWSELEVPEEFTSGIDLVYNKFFKTLEKHGVKPMEVGPGSDFDAEYHEAVSQIPAPEESLKGKVVDVIEKGYFLGDKVLRYAKVVVGA